MMYLPTPILQHEIQTYNTNFMSDSMLMNFLFYSSDPAQEEPFKTLPQDQIQVYFMGNVDYFLGNTFNWLQHAGGNISVHLWQSAFTALTDH